MKILALISIAVASLVPAGNKLDPGQWKINLTGTLVDAHDDVRIYALYNRPTYPGRLGSGFVHCTTLNARFTDCSVSLRLTRGQIVGRAVVSRASAFRQYAIGGGTGLYANIAGQMFIQPAGAGSGTVLILADLTAF